MLCNSLSLGIRQSACLANVKISDCSQAAFQSIPWPLSACCHIKPVVKSLTVLSWLSTNGVAPYWVVPRTRRTYLRFGSRVRKGGTTGSLLMQPFTKLKSKTPFMSCVIFRP